MTDFNNVERLDDIDIVRGTNLKVAGSYVNSDDFDALLAAYKELQAIANEALDMAMEECDEKCESLGCPAIALKRQMEKLLQP